MLDKSIQNETNFYVNQKPDNKLTDMYTSDLKQVKTQPLKLDYSEFRAT